MASAKISTVDVNAITPSHPTRAERLDVEDLAAEGHDQHLAHRHNAGDHQERRVLPDAVQAAHSGVSERQLIWFHTWKNT